MTVVTVDFETDLESTLRETPQEVARDVRRVAVIVWYAQGKVSQGMGAELAGLSRAEFIDVLSASGVSPIQETFEEIREALSLE